ncbi:ATP5O family protein [Megaselia abdita]
MVKAPVQVFGLEGRYATALYSAASKLKQLDQVEKELVTWQQTLKNDSKLRDIVVSPIINRKVLSTALKDTCEKLRLSAATSNLLQVLADNGRMKKLDTVINHFKTIMAAHRGDVVCEVTTAKPLDDSQRKQLEGALKAFLKSNEKLQLTSKVDPSIIGGLIVSVGDKYVDMSIASKVKMYKDLISTSA